MDTQRLILVVIFSMSLLFLWEAWQKQHQPAAPVAQQTQPPAAGVPTPSVPTAAPAAPQATPAVPAAPESAKTRDVVTVVTDLVRAEIDLAGGEIVVLDLLQHKDTVDLNKSYLLLNPAYRYAAQSGLLGPGLPTHKAAYTAVAREFKLADGQDKLEVRLETTTPEGLKAAKILTFRRGSYVIDVTHEFTNPKSEPIPAHAYFQLTRDDKAPPGDQAMLQTFTGVGVFTDSGKYQKVSWSDIAKNKTPYPKTADNGWIGVVQHYFVSAIVPPEKAEREYYTREIAKDLFSAGVILPLGSVAPGATATATTRLYSGPQDQDQLKALAPGLDLVVDYGWLTIIAAPLFWVLKLLHGWFGNWGLAIIGLTVLIKAIFYPLSAASYKSMAKMKQVTPRLMKIREQYSNDRAKMNQAMMELYKTEKINPLGGCLPIVVQIP
nr:membrane protein insertase YidC [Burkholderiales bacterium]